MFSATGDLKRRIEYNKRRLSDEQYRAPAIFTKNLEWPGDWQGRAILALSSLYESTGDLSVLKQLNDIIDGLPNYLNSCGYYGEIIGEECANEQQISGNSWFVRGLCACYEITGNEKTYAILKKIKDSLFLNIADFYKSYTVEKLADGGVSGHVTEKSADGWKHSSDTGCAFIMLDGITSLCEIFPERELIGVARAMADIFTSVDCVEANFQTHAFLSATRGILRLYYITGEEKYLHFAVKNFKIYEEFGSTLNYANFNWFKSYSSWTEPCAFIDSLILATELYKITENRDYLKFANRVYLNAFRTAQRSNGGAGCETCLCEENGVMKPHIVEAFFCCTMRLSNGLNYIRKNLFVEKNGVITAAFTVGGEYSSDDLAFNYEYDAENALITVTVTNGVLRKLRVYLPDNVCMFKDGKETGEVLENLSVGKHVYEIKAINKSEVKAGKKALFWNDYLLTEKKYEDFSPIRFYMDGKVLSPCASCIEVEEKFGLDKFVQSV